LAPSVPMLIPGVGSQEGNLEGSVLSAMSKSGANFLINASRSIIYASERKDTFQAASAEAANSLRERIENIIGKNPR